MSEEQPNNPLHGITLKAILESLVERYGWEGLASRIRVRCFENDPSIASSLVFLRRTPWAREKVERLYLRGDRGRRGFKGPSRRTPANRTSNPGKPDTPRGSGAE